LGGYHWRFGAGGDRKTNASSYQGKKESGFIASLINQNSNIIK